MAKLTHDNFLLYCAKVYDNPEMHSTEEFLEDINRISYIKKQLTRYKETGELNYNLVMNHIITLHNCFSNHLAKILFLKLEQQFSLVKPFLVLINALPPRINNVSKYDVVCTDTIELDPQIVVALRGILRR